MCLIDKTRYKYYYLSKDLLNGGRFVMDTLKQDLMNDFEKVYNKKAESFFFAPGRINLIGEHIDYSGGLVMPATITLGTYALVKKREDEIVNFYSNNFKEIGVISVDLNDLRNDPKDNWANYPKGVIWAMVNLGIEFSHGLDILFFGNIPNGAGLSSSASIQLLTGEIFRTYFSLDLTNIDLALLAQKSENEFIGVNCGIMDQFAVAMGKENQAILLNTETLEYSYNPVVLEDKSILIMNTNKRRGLEDSAYNQRIEECSQALSIIQDHYDVEHICSINTEELLKIKSYFKDPIIYKRAHHAVSENERTLLSSKVLKEGNVEAFGKLLNESHLSLKNDYEVSSKELDCLVENAWLEEGVLGARLTGAGFGGCAIAIIEDKYKEQIIKNISEKYLGEIGYEADFYIAEIGPGLREIK